MPSAESGLQGVTWVTPEVLVPLEVEDGLWEQDSWAGQGLSEESWHWASCQDTPVLLGVKDFWSVLYLQHCPCSSSEFLNIQLHCMKGRLILHCVRRRLIKFLTVISLQAVSSPRIWLPEWSSRCKLPMENQERFQAIFPYVLLLLRACVNTKCC